MPLYFFHLRDGVDVLLDPDGCDLKDQEAVEARTLRTARCLLSAEAMEGRLPLYMHIDVEDESGTVLHSLCFEDAIELILPDD